MHAYRRLDAVEHGYVAYLTAMERFATPKNHVICGYYSPSETLVTIPDSTQFSYFITNVTAR